MAIERIEVPSDAPSVSGNYGASPKQLEIRDVFWGEKRRPKMIAAAGANRSGKTVGIWGMCLCRYLRDHAKPGELFWCVAPDFTKLKQGPHKWLWEYLPRDMFKDRVYVESVGLGTNPILALDLPSGGTATVVFKTEEQDLKSYESDSVTGVGWTEAAREALLDAMLARLVDTNGWMLLDFVPTEAWHTTRLKMKAVNNPLWHYYNFAMIDNGHNLPEGAIEEARSGMSARDAAVRIDGKEGSSFGVVYREFDPEKHVCSPFEFESIARYRCYDYGYRNPYACLWAALLPSGFHFPKGVGGCWAGCESDREILVVYREQYESERTIPQQASAIKSASGRERYRFNNRIIVDPSIYNRTQVGSSDKARSIAELMRDEGLRCRRGKRGKGQDMHAQVAKVRRWFEDDKILFFDTCENAIIEHQAWKYKENKDGIAPGQEPFEDKNDHTVDSLRYLLSENLTYEEPSYDVIPSDE